MKWPVLYHGMQSVMFQIAVQYTVQCTTQFSVKCTVQYTVLCTVQCTVQCIVQCTVQLPWAPSSQFYVLQGIPRFVETVCQLYSTQFKLHSVRFTVDVAQ